MSTETITTSWGSRVGGSFKGLVVGLIVIVVGVCVLFWNEGRTIKTSRALKEGAKNVVEADPNSVDPSNEGKLVHLSGEASTDDVLTDDFFNLQVVAFQFQRKVEIYQWNEDVQEKTERTSGGGQQVTKTYSYRKDWADSLIDSSQFHDSGYNNPTQVPVESAEFLARAAKLGAFKLNEGQIGRIGPSATFNPNARPADVPSEGEQAPNPEARYHASDVVDPYAQETEPVLTVAPTGSNDLSISVSDAPKVETSSEPISGSSLSISSDLKTDDATGSSSLINGFQPYNDGFYKGKPGSPEIGDSRVSYTYVPTPSKVSVVARQVGDSFEPYKAKSGVNVDLLVSEIQSADEMFANAQKANAMMAWLLRAVGMIAIFIGFKMLFEPLVVLADIIPFAAKIVGFGSGLIALCGTLFLGLTSIAVGYLYYRPILGGALLAVAVAALLYPFFKGKKTRQVDAA